MSVLKEGEIAVRARVYGTVQGVWYRGWTEETAKGLGLFGWVRNRCDGTVEALLCGEEAGVEKMVGLLYEGPATAQVQNVETSPAQGLYPRRFDVKPTV